MFFAMMAMPFGAMADDDCYMRGDADGNGRLDIDDVTLVIASVLNGGAYNPAADMNEDGIVDIDDVTALINIVLGI